MCINFGRVEITAQSMMGVLVGVVEGHTHITPLAKAVGCGFISGLIPTCDLLSSPSVETESSKPGPKNQLPSATDKANNMEGDPGMLEPMEQSVVTLMGEIGKHIQGQFQEAAGLAISEVEGVHPVTSTTLSLEEEDSEKGGLW